MPVELESTEFYAEDLIKALHAEGLASAKVYQSGGGTATFEIREEPQDEALLIGPGSYDWRDSSKSVFTTDELSYGADSYDVEGELKDEDPEQFYIHPDTELPEVARLVAAEYRKMNP